MTASTMPADALPNPDATEPTGPAEPAIEDPEEQKRRRRRAAILLLLLAALLIFLLLVIWYLLFRQPIVPPIPVIPETQIPSYSTSIYGVSRPVGVAVTPDGSRIYVAESGGGRFVKMFDGGGNQIGTMQPPGEMGPDHVPVYVAIDPLTEEVYVTDRPTGSIYIYDRDGRFQRPFTAPAELGAWQPLGIAFDRQGTLYVTDLAGETPSVVAFDRTGNIVRTIGIDQDMRFPNGVALDGAGNLYVTDSNNGRLLVFDRNDQVVSRIGRGAGQGNFGLPRGLAADGSGRLFVVDTSGQGVGVYRTFKEGDRRLEYYGFFGTPGIGDGQFSFPNGAAVDDRGRVYVTDSGNNRIQVWSY